MDEQPKYKNIKVPIGAYWKIKELAAKKRMSMSAFLTYLVEKEPEPGEDQREGSRS